MTKQKKDNGRERKDAEQLVHFSRKKEVITPKVRLPLADQVRFVLLQAIAVVPRERITKAIHVDGGGLNGFLNTLDVDGALAV